MSQKNSSRSFGILFFLVFLVIGLWPLLNENEIRLWSIILSMIFLFLGLIKSKILLPLNRYWIKLGEILGRIIAPIVMLIIFLMVVTPISILVKIFQKDILGLKFNKNIDSYWVTKEKNSGSMKNQF